MATNSLVAPANVNSPLVGGTSPITNINQVNSSFPSLKTPPNTNINVTPTPTGSIKNPLATGSSTIPTYGGAQNPTPTPPPPTQVPKPVSVVSTSPATVKASQIQTTVNNQTTANTTAANTPSPYNDVRDANGLLMNPPGAKFDRNTGAPLNQTSSTTTTAPTAEDKIANTPDTGMQEAYNLTTGQRQDQPIGTLPSGYSSHNPISRTDVSGTATDTNGVQYKQFSDGTYARIDESGNYSPATAASYQAAKGAQDISDKIKAIQNGTFKLPPNQQAQLDGLSAKYAGLIQQQQTLNANTTGATTLAENMYGMGNNLIGQGVITKTVTDGLQKIQQLQFELANGLAIMTDAFQKDDMSMLKDSYDSYQSNQTKLQGEIDKQTAYLQSESDKQRAVIDSKNMNYALQQAAKYGDAGILPTDTPQEVDQKKQQNSSLYKYETSTKSGSIDQNALDGMLASYKKTGAIPSFGLGATGNPMRTAFYAALGGNTNLVDNAATNKAALTASTKALETQQNQYSANLTSIDTLKKSLDLASTYESKIDKTGSPLVNQYLQWIQGKAAGNKDISALNTAITTAATEYAKILSGASASIGGVSVSSSQDVKNVLDSAMSHGQFETVMNVIKADANNKLSSQKTTIDGITKDITDIGKAGDTLNDSNSSSATSAPSTGFKNGGAF